jgi:kinesin family member 2/24
MLSPHASQEIAKVLYFKLWALHVDSRALLQRPDAGSTQNTSTVPVRPKEWQLKPGMIFSVRDTEELVMLMGPGKDGMFVCADVKDAGHGKYELFVAEQMVLQSLKLGEELKLGYDRDTRYYLNPKEGEE